MARPFRAWPAGSDPSRESGTWARLLSDLDTTLDEHIAKFETKRVTTGSINATTYAAVTVTWDTAFADANYTAVVTVLQTAAAGAGMRVDRIRDQQAASIAVVVYNPTAGALTGTLHCIGIAD